MLVRHIKISIVLLIVCVCTIGRVSANSSQTNTASFYGATHLLHTPSASSLHVTLQFTVSQGTILTAHTLQQLSLVLTLTPHNLTAGLITPKGQLEPIVAINISQSDSPVWAATELLVTKSTLSLTLGNTTVDSVLSQHFNFTGELYLGGDPSRNSSSANFVGCLSNLTVNSAENILFPPFLSGGYDIGCCVPPRRLPSRSGFEPLPWGEVRVDVRSAMSDEGSNVTISDSNLRLVLPNNLVGYDVGYWLRNDLESYTVFDVVTQPSSGHFTRGGARLPGNRFHYQDLLSNSLHEIVYHHGGSQGGTIDSTTLRAHFVCEDGGEGPWSQELVLSIGIVERNHHPRVERQSVLSLAIGTRRVLTPQIITVVDRETTNASNIQYSVEYVGAADCELCQSDPRGQVERTSVPGQMIRFFTQEEINTGGIAFQHFARSGSEYVHIGLRVQDSKLGDNTIHLILLVHPRPGTITFNPPNRQDCIFVLFSHSTLLSPAYLNTTTDFEDQDPIVEYDVLQMPSDGRLEVYESKLNRWLLVNETLPFRPVTPPVLGYFTQDDIDNDRVRYSHTAAAVGGLDHLHFRLRSAMYVQVSGEEFDVCFHILTEELLVQPEFLVERSVIELDEGGHVLIGPSLLAVSLSDKEFLYSPGGGVGVDIRIQELSPILIVETAPSAGRIEVNNQTVMSGGNFTLKDLQGGAVYYHHHGDEVHTDAFGIHVQATTEVLLIKQPFPSEIVTMDVAIAPVNNHEPVYSSVSDITVTEGSYVVLTRDSILIEDGDLPGDTLYIHFRKPRSNKPQEIPTGIFAFDSSSTTPINKCTMDDILNNRVIFSHLLDESAALSFLQTMKISDGSHIILPKPQITVTAIPHNLTAQLVNTSPCSFRVDLIDSPAVQFDRTHFLFTMTDRHGEDANLIEMVDVTVGESPQYGKLLDESQAPVSQFTVSQLHLGKIRYQFSGEINQSQVDVLSLNFKYGHSTVGPIQIRICIDPIPVPDIILVNPAQVSQEGVSNISSAHLWANNTRGERGEAILYEITDPPQLGDIVNQLRPTIPIQNFTQADIDEGLIGYNRRSEVGGAADSLGVRVCTVVRECSQSFELMLAVLFVDLKIVNTGINVTEGGNHTFTLDNLSATAPPGYSRIRFFLQAYPDYGKITVNYEEIGSVDDPQYFDLEDIELTRLIYFSDIKHEVLMDRFSVKVHTELNGNALTLIEVVQIRIIPVNDHIPVVVNLPQGSLAVAKGGSIQILSSSLSAHDYDSDINDLDLIYTTIPFTPTNGYLYLDTDPGDKSLEVGKWTERDIREGRLYYKTTITKNEIDFNDAIIIRVDENIELSKTKRSGNKAVILISVIDIIFKEEPNLIEFSVPEGGTKAITSDFLEYFADNDHSLRDDQIEYQIVQVTEFGVLRLGGVVVEIGAKFSQQKIVDGELNYTHDHSNSFRDAFTFRLGDVNDRTSRDVFTFDIAVEVIDDDPPEVVIRKPVLVLQDSKVLIGQDVIQITDHDTVRSGESISSDRVVCILIKKPLHGLLETLPTGATSSSSWRLVKEFDEFTKHDIDNMFFRYENTLLDSTNDSFTFRVTDGQNHMNTTHRVEIFILPVTVPLALKALTVDEDSHAPFESEHFVVDHFYLSTVVGTIFILSPPTRGYVENGQTGETHITNFTTTQLHNKSIVYRHNGEEGEQDSMVVRYRSNNPEGLNRESDALRFTIDVIPTNDQGPILNPLRRRTLQLWWKERRVLDQRYFDASDGDTPTSQLRYNILPLQHDGYIAYSNNTDTPISTFTQAEVNERKVSFVTRTDQDGAIQYRVTDGDFYTTGNLTFQADPLLLVCAVPTCSWSPVSVAQRGEVVLSLDNLCCETNADTPVEREILYHIDSVEYGEFYVSGTSVVVFTKRQLQEGVVSYRHTDMDRWEDVDVVRLYIETDFQTYRTRSASINIDLPRPSERGRPAINNDMRVTEGRMACLNISSLDARNVRYESWLATDEQARPKLTDMDVVYILSQLPVRGTLIVNGRTLTSSSERFRHSDLANGSVCYQHDDSETKIDSFRFRLTVVGPPQFGEDAYEPVDTFNINIEPVNDIRPILETINPNVQLVEGFPYTLTTNDLSITDEDSSPQNVLIYIDSLPRNAMIFQGESPLKVGEYFSQWQVDTGTVSLRPVSPLPSKSDSFSFHFTDEDEASLSSEAELTVTVVKHSLDVTGTRRVTYQQNESKARITREFLNSETNADNRVTTFTVVTAPREGSIEKQEELSGPRTDADTFTQHDVNEGRVWYIPDIGSREHSDSFVVSVSNSNLTVPRVEVSVRVLVWGEIKRGNRVVFPEDQEELSYQLPVDIIELNSQGVPPALQLIEAPKYGHLELKITPSTIERVTRSVGENLVFHYDDLQRGWMYYVWDSQLSVGDVLEVRDNFTLLVNQSSMRPGEAFIELDIVPPSTLSQPIVTTPVSTPSNNPPSDTEVSAGGMVSGFPVYTLIPILGVIVILLLIIVIITFFCLTQQKKIRKKFHLHPLDVNVSSPNGIVPISPSISPTRHVGPQFNFDPNGHDLSSEDDRNSLSSGFSEDGELPPMRSPLRSPTHSHTFSYSPSYPAQSGPSPTYTSHRPHPPFARRPRVLSHVSITPSGRRSALSDTSVGNPSLPYSHSLPRPPPCNIAVPIPMRPASQATYCPVRGESGYNSCNQTSQNSRQHSVSNLDKEGEPVCGEFPSALEDDCMAVPGTTLEAESDMGCGVHKLYDPDVQQLFNSSHPVLKKQEYWF